MRRRGGGLWMFADDGDSNQSGDMGSTHPPTQPTGYYPIGTLQHVKIVA